MPSICRVSCLLALAASVVTVAGSTGCDGSVDVACTEIGCSDGLAVVVHGSSGVQYDVEASATGGETRTGSCAIDASGSCLVFFYGFLPDEVTVAVTGGGRQMSVTLQPAYEDVQPNGPDCPPTCRQATVTIDLQAGDAQVRRILNDPGYEWVTIETPATRIHYPAGSFAETKSALLPQQVEESRTAVLRLLNARDRSSPVDLFYVDSRHDMESLVGSPVAGFAYYDDDAVILVFNSTWRAFERHELTHVVTLGTWPSPAGDAVVEGLATYVDGYCGGYENGRVARTILDTGAGLALETLTGEFRLHDDLVAYLLAASAIDFAVERLDREVIRTLWDQGLGAVPELLELSTREYESQFQDWLSSTYDPVPPAAWDAIRAAGCGIDVRADIAEPAGRGMIATESQAGRG